MSNGQDFAIKLLRFIGAELHVSVSMQAAHALFGQSLFALTEQQRRELNERLDALISPGFELLTEKNLTPPSGGTSGLVH